MEINNDKQINNTDVIGLGVKSMNKEDDLFDIKKSLENMGKRLHIDSKATTFNLTLNMLPYITYDNYIDTFNKTINEHQVEKFYDDNNYVNILKTNLIFSKHNNYYFESSFRQNNIDDKKSFFQFFNENKDGFTDYFNLDENEKSLKDFCYFITEEIKIYQEQINFNNISNLDVNYLKNGLNVLSFISSSLKNLNNIDDVKESIFNELISGFSTMINNPNLDNQTKNDLKLTIIDNYSEIFNSLLDKNSVNEYEINDNNFEFINNSYKNMFNLICSDYYYDTKQNYVVSDNYIFNEFAIKFSDFIKFNNTKNLSEENKNKFIDDVFVPYFNSAFLNNSLHKNDTTNSKKMIKIIDEFDIRKIKENLSNTNLLKVFIRWSDKIQYDINNENSFSTIKINRDKYDYENLFKKLITEGINNSNENIFYSLNKNDISNKKTILGFNKVDYSNDFKPIQFSRNREWSIYEKVHFNENSLMFNVYNLFNTKFNDETSLPMLQNEFEIFDYVHKKNKKYESAYEFFDEMYKNVLSEKPSEKPLKKLDGNEFNYRLNDIFLKFVMDFNYKINLNMNYYNNLITNHLINKEHLNNYNFLDTFSEELYKNQQNEIILENKVFKDYLFLTTLEFASNKDEIINKIKQMDMSKDLDLISLRNECDYDLSSKNYNIKYMSCILQLISDCDTYSYHELLKDNPDLKDILNKFENIINENNKNLYNENIYTKDLTKFFNNDVNDGNYVLFENLFNYAKNENFSEEKLLKTLNTLINNHKPFFIINKTVLTSDFNKVNECLLNNDEFEEQNDLYSFMVCLNLINSIKSEKYPEFNNTMKKVLDKHIDMTNLDISMKKLTGIINTRNVDNKEISIHNLDRLTKEIKSNYLKTQKVKEKARQHYQI